MKIVTKINVAKINKLEQYFQRCNLEERWNANQFALPEVFVGETRRTDGFAASSASVVGSRATYSNLFQRPSVLMAMCNYYSPGCNVDD